MEIDSEKALQTLCNSAWAAHAKGNETEAEKLFRQCLEVEPESIEAIYGLALVMKPKGKMTRQCGTLRKSSVELKAGNGKTMLGQGCYAD